MSATLEVQQSRPGTVQVHVPQQPGGGGGGGGRGGGGPHLPECPKDEGLLAFVIFVHDLLQFWQQRAQNKVGEFEDLGSDDRSALAAGWADFSNQWGSTLDDIQAAIRDLDEDELRRRGLMGSAYQMKWHFIRKWREKLAAAYQAVGEQMRIRPLWHRLFTATDILLDSTERALSVVPVAGAIVSGLKEFKETAMGVTEGEKSS